MNLASGVGSAKLPVTKPSGAILTPLQPGDRYSYAGVLSLECVAQLTLVQGRAPLFDGFSVHEN